MMRLFVGSLSISSCLVVGTMCLKFRTSDGYQKINLEHYPAVKGELILDRLESSGPISERARRANANVVASVSTRDDGIKLDDVASGPLDHTLDDGIKLLQFQIGDLVSKGGKVMSIEDQGTYFTFVDELAELVQEEGNRVLILCDSDDCHGDVGLPGFVALSVLAHLSFIEEDPVSYEGEDDTMIEYALDRVKEAAVVSESLLFSNGRQFDSISFHMRQFRKVDLPQTLKDIEGSLMIYHLPGRFGQTASRFIRKAQKAGVQVIAALHTDQEGMREGRHYQQVLNLFSDIGGIPVHRFPIEDFTLPTNDELFLEYVDSIAEKMKQGNKVLLHCFGGWERSGMVARSILLRLGGEYDAVDKAVSDAGSPLGNMGEKWFVLSVAAKTLSERYGAARASERPLFHKGKDDSAANVLVKRSRRISYARDHCRECFDDDGHFPTAGKGFCQSIHLKFYEDEFQCAEQVTTELDCRLTVQTDLGVKNEWVQDVNLCSKFAAPKAASENKPVQFHSEPQTVGKLLLEVFSHALDSHASGV